MKWSVAGKNLSRFPYDVVWDHAFEDMEGVRAYWVHPYHCDKLDEFLYKECPGNIVEEAIHIFYDDQQKYQA